MADTKTHPKSQRDLARERALLAHEETGIYVDAEELVRFDLEDKHRIAKLPLSSVQRVDGLRLAPRQSLTFFAMGAGFTYYLLAEKPGVGWSWAVSVCAWICLLASYGLRWRMKLRVRGQAQELCFPADDDDLAASGFAASLQLLLRDHATGTLAKRYALTPPPQEPIEVEASEAGASASQTTPILGHDPSMVYLLGNELVRLDERRRFAARFPLADIRAFRAVRRPHGSILALFFALFLVTVSAGIEESTWLSSAWFGWSVFFALIACPFRGLKSRLRLELDGKAIQLPLDMRWAEAKVFAASLTATAAAIAPGPVRK